MNNIKKDIEPTDKNGKYHGYQQWYSLDDIWLRCISKHGKVIGYKETHLLLETQFHIR